MKLTNMVFIVTGLMILFWLAGLNTSIGYVLGQLGVTENPTGLVGSELYSAVFSILTLAGLGIAVGIGFLTKSPIENLLIIPLVLLFLAFLGDLMSIISITSGVCGPTSSCVWITWVVIAIIVPTGIAYLMATVDWWRGRD